MNTILFKIVSSKRVARCLLDSYNNCRGRQQKFGNSCHKLNKIRGIKQGWAGLATGFLLKIRLII